VNAAKGWRDWACYLKYVRATASVSCGSSGSGSAIAPDRQGSLGLSGARAEACGSMGLPPSGSAL